MNGLKLIVCDNCFVVRKEEKERKCPICETGTLRITTPKYPINTIDAHSLQDLLKQVKKTDGLKHLIEDAFVRYNNQFEREAFNKILKFLRLRPEKRNELGKSFLEVTDQILDEALSERRRLLLEASSKVLLINIDTLIDFERVLHDFKDTRQWSSSLLNKLIVKYELQRKNYLICCESCVKLYRYSGLEVCVFCDSHNTDNFDGEIIIGEEANEEEVLALLIDYAAEHRYNKLNMLLPAYFNTTYKAHIKNSKQFYENVEQELNTLQPNNHSALDLLALSYKMRDSLLIGVGYAEKKPQTTGVYRLDVPQTNVLHDHSFNDYNPVYKNISRRSPVFGSVFSPSEVTVPSGFLVQVYIYDVLHKEEITAIAKAADEDAGKRMELSLGDNFSVNQKLEVALTAPGLIIDQPVQSVIWKGNINTLQFIVDVPEEYKRADTICTAIISSESIPIGHMKFKVKFMKSGNQSEKSEPVSKVAHLTKYKRVFISYASEDRTEVLKRVQMLQASGVDFFQDIVSLEPGDDWEKLLYKNILVSDAFFLFWSTAASKSKWVKKELIYALSIKNGKEENSPEIIPVIIEGPPVPPPPDELSFLHFNDTLLYLMDKN